MMLVVRNLSHLLIISPIQLILFKHVKDVELLNSKTVVLSYRFILSVINL